MAMEDQEMMAEGPGEEDGGESSNRTFMMLALGLGGLFVVGVICIVAIFFYQQNQRNALIARNNAQIAKNATAIAEATTQAMLTQAPAVAAPTNTPTSVPTKAPTAAPTSGPTNTPVPVVAAVVTPTTVVTATTSRPASGATAISTTVEATATLAADKTPQTGVGGLGMALAASALLVVLFAARRLRLAQH